MATYSNTFSADTNAMTLHRQFDEMKRNQDDEMLEQFRVGNHSAMKDELAELIQYDDIPLRYVHIVGRVAREIGRLYRRRPKRTFGDHGDGLVKLFKRSGLNLALAEASERLVAHAAVVLGMVPDAPGRVRVQSYCPFECRVSFDQAWKASSSPISEASEVRIKTPLRAEAGVTVFGWTVYTPEDAYVLYPDGTQVPVFPWGIKHGFSGIPLIAVRSESPEAGRFFPSPPYDLLSAQILVDLHLSDILYIASRQCHGQLVINGNGARQVAQEMASGVSHAMVVESNGPGDIAVELLQNNPALEKYIKAVDLGLRFLETSRHLQLGTLGGSTGITGDAKAQELRGAEEEARRYEELWRNAEVQLAELIVEGLKLDMQPGWQAFPEDIGDIMAIDYLYVKPLTNDLQTAQSFEIALRQGLASVEEEVSSVEGISIEEARTLITHRLQSLKDRMQVLGGVSMPGLDQIDNNFPIDTIEPTEPEEIEDMSKTEKAKAAVQKDVNEAALSLNGAQVQAIVQVATAVNEGTLSASSAAAIVAFAFGVDHATATRMVKK